MRHASKKAGDIREIRNRSISHRRVFAEEAIKAPARKKGALCKNISHMEEPGGGWRNKKYNSPIKKILWRPYLPIPQIRPRIKGTLWGGRSMKFRVFSSLVPGDPHDVPSNIPWKAGEREREKG
jgi:hypothetical protein